MTVPTLKEIARRLEPQLFPPRQLPVLFAPDLAQKVHLGLKTQTRRPMKPQPEFRDTFQDWLWKGDRFAYRDGELFDARATFDAAPYRPGDLLYVRETFALIAGDAVQVPAQWCEYRRVFNTGPWMQVWYRGAHEFTAEDRADGLSRWQPSIHMPKWAARTWLEVTRVRAERVQDITEGDAEAEGYHKVRGNFADPAQQRHRFALAWDRRYPGSWDRNDWVFAYDFKKVDRP